MWSTWMEPTVDQRAYPRPDCRLNRGAHPCPCKPCMDRNGYLVHESSWMDHIPESLDIDNPILV